MPVDVSARARGAATPGRTHLPASPRSAGSDTPASSSLPDLALALARDSPLARNHRLNVANGLVSIVATNLAVSFYAIYAQRWQASNTQIALLSSLPAVVMALAFLPAAQCLERRGTNGGSLPLSWRSPGCWSRYWV